MRAADDIGPDRLSALYRAMVRIRLYEEEVARMVESGEARCPCHLYIGQEGVAAGVCAALEREDTVWGGHRSHGHYLAKGGDGPAMLAEILGKRTGCSGGRGGSMHLLAREVGILGTVPLVAASIPLAVGAALASRVRGDRRVAAAFFGDGAVDEGHFHESVHMAALYRLPVVFVCENNLYSSHMGLLEHRALDNIHRLAEVHGAAGERVDGNDVVEVHRAAREAVHRARQERMPTLLECRTYRWRGHVGPSWDMDVGVERKDELKEWLPRDPVARARERLLAMEVSPQALTAIEDDARVEVAEAARRARSDPLPDPGSLLEHVYRVIAEGGGGR